MLFPVTVAGEDDGSGPFPRVRGSEFASDARLNPDNFEKVGGNAGNHRARRLQSACNRAEARAVFCNVLEAVVLLTKIGKIGIGKARPSSVRVNLEDSHNAVGLDIR